MRIAIKELRDRTNLSQKEFAKQYEIPLSTLRKWEQGDSAPAPYVVKMLARQIHGEAEKLERIECKNGRTIYYDSISGSLSDSFGNTIFIQESLEGVKRQNLPIYAQDLFESFYSIKNKFNKDIELDKDEDIIWG